MKLPDTCNALGINAFANCENLIALIIPGENSKLNFTWDPYGENSPLKGTKIIPIEEQKDDVHYGRIFVNANTYDYYMGNTSEDSGNWSEFAPFIRKIDEYKDICGIGEN